MEHVPMTEERGLNDLDYLTWVAEGRAAMVPADVNARLLAAGLLVQTDHGAVDRQRFELSPAGLRHIRSSDQ
jgi:hypothetical protein